MTLAGRIGFRCGRTATSGSASAQDPGAVLCGGWLRPGDAVGSGPRANRRKRGMIALNRSPLARRIITFNLLAMVVLVIGVLYLNPFRDSLVIQRESGLVNEAQLVADVFEAQLPAGAPVNLGAGDGIDPLATIAGIELSEGAELFLFDTTQGLIASTETAPRAPVEPVEGLGMQSSPTLLSELLNRLWDGA